METNSTHQNYIVVARRVAPGWFEVVEQFTPPAGDIAYPYMRAAYADAQARSVGSAAEFQACLLRSPIDTGRMFRRLTVDAIFIDQHRLQSTKPERLPTVETAPREPEVMYGGSRPWYYFDTPPTRPGRYAVADRDHIQAWGEQEVEWDGRQWLGDVTGCNAWAETMHQTVQESQQP